MARSQEHCDINLVFSGVDMEGYEPAHLIIWDLVLALWTLDTRVNFFIDES